MLFARLYVWADKKFPFDGRLCVWASNKFLFETRLYLGEAKNLRLKSDFALGRIKYAGFSPEIVFGWASPPLAVFAGIALGHGKHRVFLQNCIVRAKNPTGTQ